jgi:hypothetical protein
MEQKRDRKRTGAREKSARCDVRSSEPPSDPGRSQIRAVQLRASSRRERWTEARRAAFLAELGATCNITQAAHVAGMSVRGAYCLRDRDATFRLGWRRALAQGYAQLEVEMLERALIAETRLRGALTEIDTHRDALKVLNEHPHRNSELLYRVHRQTALEQDGADDDPDGEEALARVRERIVRLRERIAEEQEPS